MNELVEFLTARLDEAAHGAEASGPHPVAWLTFCDADGRLQYTAVGSSADERGESGIWIVDGKEVPAPTFVHVIYDPALALREVEAKRRIVAEHPPVTHRESQTIERVICGRCRYDDGVDYTYDHPCPTLELLALPYSDHPDYQEEWRV